MLRYTADSRCLRQHIEKYKALATFMRRYAPVAHARLLHQVEESGLPPLSKSALTRGRVRSDVAAMLMEIIAWINGLIATIGGHCVPRIGL